MRNINAVFANDDWTLDIAFDDGGLEYGVRT